MIIFPAIDLRNGKAVRLVEGDFKQETVYAEELIWTALWPGRAETWK